MNSGRVQLYPDGRSPRALRMSLKCDYSAVRRGADQLRTFLTGYGLPEKDIWGCELAFVEGCNNAIQHNSRRSPGDSIQVEILCGPDEIELRISDRTPGFDWPAQVDLPPQEEESGRGLFIMNAVMDHVHYVRNGTSNCLVLKKTLTGI